MLPLIAGFAALVLLLVLAGGFVRADIVQLAKSLRRVAAILLALGAVGLLVMGRIGLAVFAGSLAWGLISAGKFPGRGSGASSGQARMSRAEALNVLGLEEGATEEDIRAAHRRLIRQAHPDTGGTNYLAAKINEAKEVLLGAAARCPAGTQNRFRRGS